MQVSADIQALGLILGVLVAIPILVGLSLLLMKLIELISSRLGKFVRYLAFPGVVLHELCHKLLCKISGVQVLEHHPQFMKNKSRFERIIVDTRQIHNFTTGVIVGFAPTIILALGLYLSLLFWSLLPLPELLKYYFSFCFFIGSAPNRTDRLIVSSVTKTRSRQTLLEISLLSLPFITAFGYIFLRPLWGHPFSIITFSLTFLAGVLVSLLSWRYYKSYRNSQKHSKIVPTSLELVNNKLVLVYEPNPRSKPVWPEEQ